MKRVVLALAVATVVAGCPKRIDFGPTGELRDPGAVLERVQQAQAGVRAVSGEAKAKLSSPQRRGVVTLFVAATEPARLHVEALDFFGKPESVLVSDGDRFALFQAQEGKLYRGPATAATLSRALPVDLTPVELTAALLGKVAFAAGARTETLAVDGSRGVYLLTLRTGTALQTLAVDPSTFRVRSSDVESSGSRWTLTFDAFDGPAGAALPRKIVLSAQAPGAEPTSVELTYRDVEVNGALDEASFTLQPPAGAEVVEVDARGEPVR